MLIKHAFRVVSILGIVLLLGSVSCFDDNSTDSGSYSVTLNVSLPSNDYDTEAVEGHAVSFYLFDANIDETALYSGTSSISSGSASIAIENVTNGDYLMLAAIDYDGETNTDLLEQGDLIWGALDVSVSGDLTINIDEDYLQRFHSIVVGIKGIPSGHTGQPLACALLEDGDSYWNLKENIVMGSVTTLYNQTAILALGPVDIEDTLDYDTEWANYQLSPGDYDMFFLIDHDGDVSDYDDEENLDPYSEGDLFFSFGYLYTQSHALYDILIATGSFEPLEFSDIQLSVNFKLRNDDYLEVTGDTVRLALWEHLEDENPLQSSYSVLDGSFDSLSVGGIPEGTYQITLTIGDDEQSNDDFMGWAALNVDISDDASISVDSLWWQWVSNMTLAVSGVPSAYEGEMVLFGVFDGEGNYFEFEDDSNFLASGLGYVYNSSAVVSIQPENDQITELPLGTYKLMVQIDPDGDYNYYNDLDIDSVQMFLTYEVGDPYWATTINYDNTAAENDFIFLNAGTFSTFLGISGTVSCPSWNDGGGDIYVLLFENNPFGDVSDSGPLSWNIISQPGDYAIPVMSGMDGYVVGVWDVNDNGMEGGGPDAGDYIGYYGYSVDSLYQVQVLSSDIEDIDITLDVLNSSTLGGGQ